MVLCMTGCAIAAFIPPAYFDGISTTRHMVGMNLATALALAISIALAASMILQALARAPRHPEPPGQRPGPGQPSRPGEIEDLAPASSSQDTRASG
jgi:hypothetical protein